MVGQRVFDHQQRFATGKRSRESNYPKKISLPTANGDEKTCQSLTEVS